MSLKQVWVILLLFVSLTVSANNNFEKGNQISLGLFSIYQIKEAYYFEIPRRLLQRDFLLSARVAELSSTNNKAKLVAGQRMYDPLLVRFAEEGDLLLLLRPDNQKICNETDAFYESFLKNNLTPIEQTFAIEHKTDSSVFINVTKFFKDQLPEVEPFNEKTKPGKIMPELTKILNIKSFPQNIEVKVRNAYQTNKDPFLVVLQKSLLLLPEKPMQPRIYDKRMGYYTLKKRLYSDSNKGVKSFEYITRFDLQPKDKDKQAFSRGKLVEPAKPIVIYIDNDFPASWKQAIKLGIEDWQPAFEAIGFKNAIVAKEYPNNPEFDPNDIRYNCFRFSVCDNANAMGVRMVDPRSGEIIQADVMYFSNVTELLHKWYFLQTAAVNEKARKKNLDEDELKKLIRYSAAHEVGHCLGLVHNFRASYAYKTESLRDKQFTKEYGTTPSIMDYARFNYIAQPEDKGVYLLPPYLGVYDKYAIKLGYQIIDVKEAEAEMPIINKWLLDKEGDPMYTFGAISMGAVMTDPSKQSADLGNNLILSSQYGIKNLKYILKHLKEWMQEDNEDYSYISGLYADVFKENFNYISNVMPMLAGIYEFDVVSSSTTPMSIIIDKKETLKAIDFIVGELKDQATWLDNAYVRSFAGSQTENLVKQHESVLNKLLHAELFRHMYRHTGEQEMIQPDEYLTYLTSTIFSGNKIDVYSDNLKQRYVEKLKAFVQDEKNKQGLFGHSLINVINKQIDFIERTY